MFVTPPPGTLAAGSTGTVQPPQAIDSRRLKTNWLPLLECRVEVNGRRFAV